MFRYCYDIIEIDLSNFDSYGVTTMENMFYYCYSLNSLDLSNFNTSSVTKNGKYVLLVLIIKFFRFI